MQYNALSVSAKFCLLLTGLYFSLGLFQAFRFLCPGKDSEFVYNLQTYFRCSVYNYIHILYKSSNYLEVATGDTVLKNFAIFTWKSMCWKETPTQVFSCVYLEIFKNTYFEKHLRTAPSDYSFTLVVYLFSAVSSKKTMIFHDEENVHWN